MRQISPSHFLACFRSLFSCSAIETYMHDANSCCISRFRVSQKLGTSAHVRHFSFDPTHAQVVWNSWGMTYSCMFCFNHGSTYFWQKSVAPLCLPQSHTQNTQLLKNELTSYTWNPILFLSMNAEHRLFYCSLRVQDQHKSWAHKLNFATSNLIVNWQWMYWIEDLIKNSKIRLPISDLI